VKKQGHTLRCGTGISLQGTYNTVLQIAVSRISDYVIVPLPMRGVRVHCMKDAAISWKITVASAQWGGGGYAN
jgi:hypothetical protein